MTSAQLKTTILNLTGDVIKRELQFRLTILIIKVSSQRTSVSRDTRMENQVLPNADVLRHLDLNDGSQILRHVKYILLLFFDDNRSVIR